MSARRTRSSARSATRSRRCRCRAGRTARAGPISATNSNAVFAASKAKEAAFKWIAFLSTAENNIELNKLTGPAADHDLGGGELDGASEALRRGERRLAADRRLAARQPEDAGLHRAHLADEHAARADRRNLAGRHDEGDRAALPRLSDPASEVRRRRRRRPFRTIPVAAADRSSPRPIGRRPMFLAPALAVTAAVVLLPVAQTVWLSLQDYLLYEPDAATFVGLGNFRSHPARRGLLDLALALGRSGSSASSGCSSCSASAPRCCSTRASGGGASRARSSSCPGRCRASSSA